MSTEKVTQSLAETKIMICSTRRDSLSIFQSWNPESNQSWCAVQFRGGVRFVHRCKSWSWNVVGYQWDIADVESFFSFTIYYPLLALSSPLREHLSPISTPSAHPGKVGEWRQPSTIDHHLAHVSSFRFSQWKPHEHSRLRKRRFLSDALCRLLPKRYSSTCGSYGETRDSLFSEMTCSVQNIRR